MADCVDAFLSHTALPAECGKAFTKRHFRSFWMLRIHANQVLGSNFSKMMDMYAEVRACQSASTSA
eukprot:6207045-Pleurochrysis_carterae.AAC.4